MYDPKFRFALLVSLFVVFGNTAHVIYTYLLGEAGLNFNAYLQGVLQVGSAILGGYGFVWLCTQFITFERFKKTGFEATSLDETGTRFFLPNRSGKLLPAAIRLTKFLPEIVAPPYDESLHPLELQLLGFLNGYRTWPYDLSGDSTETLYEHAISQWEAMNSLPGSTHLHRIAALAQDLSLVYAYEERRKSYPYSTFWKRDDVSYGRRCNEHGGLSAFILSTLPAFRRLGKDMQSNARERRALLTAIKYRDNPSSIPANCDPLAREIYEYLHKAYQKSLLKGKDDTFEPTSDDVHAFNHEVYSYFQAVVRDLEVNPSDVREESDGVYLGNGQLIARMGAIAQKYATVLSPHTRGQFHLWDMAKGAHPSWRYFIDALAEHNIHVDTWDDVKTTNGLFNVRISGVDFSNAVILNVDAMAYPELRKSLDTLPKWEGLVEINQNEETLVDDIKRKAADMTGRLAGILDVG